jgi:PAS domain-containing protein
MSANTELLKLLPAAVYVTDAKGRLTFYNDAAAELWGYRPELGTTRWCGSWRLYCPDGRPMGHDERGAEAIAERPDGACGYPSFPTLRHCATLRVA